MAEGVFDDYEMEDLSENYPEYNDMNEQQMNDEYDNLTRTRRGLFIDLDATEDCVEEIRKRIDYIVSILENRQRETTFTDNNRLAANGKTVVT